MAFAGDLDRVFRAVDVKTGAELWRVRLPTSVLGFPVSFSAGGRQYIAVTTGINGSQVLATMLTDVHHPSSGTGLYVFALPEKK